jgi:GTPase SAR1 family protein
MNGGNIAIVGPRKSGKTTYLAGLAYHSHHEDQQGIKYTITIQNEDSKNLKEEAERILLPQKDFKGTNKRDKTVFQLPYFGFFIDYKPSRFKASQRITITTRDYSGELFDDLEKSSFLSNEDEEFVKDFFTNKIGCIVLLTSWELGADNKYHNMLKNFLEIMDRNNVDSNYKIAVVMTKCETGEIWTGRFEPERDLFDVHLKKTKDLLRQKLKPNTLKFFALSTFGILSQTDPRPNRLDRIVKGEPASVLRQPEVWKPYNLIEPLLWIAQTSKSTTK